MVTIRKGTNYFHVWEEERGMSVCRFPSEHVIDPSHVQTITLEGNVDLVTRGNWMLT